MSKEPSPNNRSIRLTEQEQKIYLERCTTPEIFSTSAVVRDAIIYGDTFLALPKLPPKSVDLLIADPPYNLLQGSK